MFIIALSTAPDVSNCPGSRLTLLSTVSFELLVGHALGRQELADLRVELGQRIAGAVGLDRRGHRIRHRMLEHRWRRR